MCRRDGHHPAHTLSHPWENRHKTRLVAYKPQEREGDYAQQDPPHLRRKEETMRNRTLSPRVKGGELCATGPSLLGKTGRTMRNRTLSPKGNPVYLRVWKAENRVYLRARKAESRVYPGV